MAAEPRRLDVAEVVSSGPQAAKRALESESTVVIRVYALPADGLRIRARKRVISLDEGSIARLVYALVTSAASAAGEGRRPRFREFASAAGDWKAAAAYLARLVEEGLATPPGGDAASLLAAANTMRQKTYEHSVARIADGEFEVNTDRFAGLPADEILCVQRGGRVACRYIVASMPRSVAKAQIRAVIGLAGLRPA